MTTYHTCTRVVGEAFWSWLGTCMMGNFCWDPIRVGLAVTDVPVVVLHVMGVTAKVVTHQQLTWAVANSHAGIVCDIELAVAKYRM